MLRSLRNPVFRNATGSMRCISSAESSSTGKQSSDERRRHRSPYAVLQLRTSATTEEIKAAFRRLAKRYHPDLNPDLRPRGSSERDGGTHDAMAELIDAYDKLLDDDFGGRVGDSRVSLACELFHIDELKMDRLHDVYALKIVYDEGEDTHLLDDEEAGEGCAHVDATSVVEEPVPHAQFGVFEQNGSGCTAELAGRGGSLSESLIEVKAHPDDSVSDVKRRLQDLYLNAWCLIGRRLDRDQLATGWELVQNQSVLSYHLFLSSYGIKNDDIIHAVVRRYEDIEREASASRPS